MVRIFTAMRIVLLLTFGFPVLATQLVAWAAPRVEPVLCARTPRVSATEPSSQTPPVSSAVRVALPAEVLAVSVPPVVVSAPVRAPEGSSARALTFLERHRRQAT